MPTQYTIWCNAKFPADAHELLLAGTAHHHLIFSQNLQASNLSAGRPDPALNDADLVFGQPDPELILSTPKLRWVHLNSAGYERYDRLDLRQAFHTRNAQVTNSSMVYEEPCAEHIVSMMFALARHLPVALDHQRTDHAWLWAPIRADSRLLLNQSVLILGYGAIARRVIQILTPLRMKLMAIRRSPRGDEPIPTFPETQIDQLLQQADHVLNILPGGASTQNFVNAHRISKMKPTAIFYNIGRGGTVDQDALLAALQQRRIAAAYLDVTSPEPLPLDHPLWTLPNCFITPHTAGGHHDEHQRLVQHFLDNLKLFEHVKPLNDRVV